MLRRRAFAAAGLAVSLLFVLAMPVSAAEPLFGPRAYTLANGKPQFYTDTFAVSVDATCEGKAVFTLLVQSSGISSATVTLNGTALLVESDFPNAPIEVPIRLNPSNTLQVQLKGGARSGVLTLSIRRDIEIPLVSPETFTLTARTGTFTSLASVSETGGTYVLEVANGDTDGHRVHSGSIVINGATVMSEKDFTAAQSLLRRVVALTATNTIRTELKGSPGDFVSVALRKRSDESVCSGVDIAFDTPAADAVIESGNVVVSGTVTGSRDVGVSVNGIGAAMDLDHAGTAADPFRWAVALTPEPGNVDLVARAMTIGGAHDSATRSIIFILPGDGALLRAEPVDGLAPLPVTFRLTEPDSGVARYEADLDGDGVYEVDSTSRPVLATSYASPGIRQATVRMTMPNGDVRTTTAIVNVQSFSSLNALFNALWQQLLGRLGAEDVEGALQMLADQTTQDKYRGALNYIRTLLPSYVASIQSFQPMELGGDVAHYLLTRRHTDGLEYGYHVYFTRDTNGVWKLVQF